MRFCKSIGRISFADLLDLLVVDSFYEIRLDLNKYNTSQIKKIFNSPAKTIVTFRGNRTEKIEHLKTAIENGANFVDFEIDNPEENIQYIKSLCDSNNAKLILSKHFYHSTPKNLQLYVSDMKKIEADYYKIITFAQKKFDALRVLQLYQNNDRLIAFSMGKKGTFSRTLSLYFGSPFTYCKHSKYGKTAPGQLDCNKTQKILDLLKDG